MLYNFDVEHSCGWDGERPPPVLPVSVVIPVRNRVATILAAVRSVLDQAPSVREVIVVDDASSDGTASCLGQIQDPRLRIVRNEVRMGVSGARNQGAMRASQEWVGFLDSDDLALPGRFLQQWELVRRQPAAVMCVCADVVVNAPEMSWRRLGGAECREAGSLLPWRIPGGSCFFLKRQALLDAGGFDLGLDCFEDWDLALRLADCGQVWLLQIPLVARYRTAGSLFENEGAHAGNLQIIVSRHVGVLQAAGSYGHYCNLIGQGLCSAGKMREGREWFLRAAASGQSMFRTTLNRLACRPGPQFYRAWLGMAKSASRAWRRLGISA